MVDQMWVRWRGIRVQTAAALKLRAISTGHCPGGVSGLVLRDRGSSIVRGGLPGRQHGHVQRQLIVKAEQKRQRNDSGRGSFRGGGRGVHYAARAHGWGTATLLKLCDVTDTSRLTEGAMEAEGAQRGSTGCCLSLWPPTCCFGACLIPPMLQHPGTPNPACAAAVPAVSGSHLHVQ